MQKIHLFGGSKMKASYFFLLLFTCNLYAQEGKLIENPIRKIPRWVRKVFVDQGLNQRYAITYQLYPPYLHGDFNNDGRKDAAILVKENSNGKLGIAIFHGKKTQALRYQVSILGAGQSFGSAGDDFKWMSLWNFVKQGKITNELGKRSLPSLNGDIIVLQKQNDGNGFIYWDGKNYEWREPKKK
jgi:hypothetical protein